MTAYFVQEKETLSDYELLDDISEVELSIYGSSVTLNYTNSKIEVEEVTKKLEIIKLDKDTNEILPGVKIRVYKDDGTLYFEGVTNDEGKIVIDIDNGEYYIEEVEALSGYDKLKGKIESFVVSDEESLYTIRIYNSVSNPKTGIMNSKIVIFLIVSGVAVIGYLNRNRMLIK